MKEIPPHPATVAQPKRAFGAGAPMPPHPATVAQPKRAFGGGAPMPPHPATVAQRKLAIGAPAAGPPRNATAIDPATGSPAAGDVLQPSLGIAGDNTFTTAICAALDQLSGNRLRYTGETMVRIRGWHIPWPNWMKVRFAHGINGLALPSTRLLAGIIGSGKSVRIEATNTHTRTEPSGSFYQSARTLMINAATPGTGTDAVVYINPADLAGSPAWVRNPVGGADIQQMTPGWLILAHELIHAHRFLRGYGANDTNTGQQILGSYDRTTGMGSALMLEEIYTVGLPLTAGQPFNPDPNAITENDLRAQYNLDIRARYP